MQNLCNQKQTHTRSEGMTDKLKSLQRLKSLSNGKNIFFSTLLHHLHYMASNCVLHLQVRIYNLQGSVSNGELNSLLSLQMYQLLWIY